MILREPYLDSKKPEISGFFFMETGDGSLSPLLSHTISY